MQGDSWQSHQLVCQHPIHTKLWKVSSNSPQLIPGVVNITFDYPIEQLLPTNTTTVINFGDGKKEKWTVPELDWTGQHVIQHEYENPGKYNVKVNMSNIVTRFIKRFQVYMTLVEKLVIELFQRSMS